MSFSFIAQTVKAVAESLHYSEGSLHLVDSITIAPTINHPALFIAKVQLTIQSHINGKRFPVCIG